MLMVLCEEDMSEVKSSLLDQRLLQEEVRLVSEFAQKSDQWQKHHKTQLQIPEREPQLGGEHVRHSASAG